MRRTRRLVLWAALLLGLCGCTTDQAIKPPDPDEQYHSPPGEDRYLNPPKFPRDTLNQGLIRRQNQDGSNDPGGPGTPGNPRAGSGPLRGPAPGPSYN